MPRHWKPEYTTADIWTAAGLDVLGVPLLRCELEPNPRYPGQQRCSWVFSNADDKAWEASTDLHATDLVLPWQGMRNAYRYLSKLASDARKQHHGSPAWSLTDAEPRN